MDNTDYRFVEQITAERSEQGLSDLVVDPELSKVASVHTDEMADVNDIYHSSRSTLEERVTNWNVLGENVGVGRTSETLHAEFMESRKHRENILRESFRRIGVGTEHRNGRLWVTVLFATERDPGTAMEMEEC